MERSGKQSTQYRSFQRRLTCFAHLCKKHMRYHSSAQSPSLSPVGWVGAFVVVVVVLDVVVVLFAVVLPVVLLVAFVLVLLLLEDASMDVSVVASVVCTSGMDGRQSLHIRRPMWRPRRTNCR